MPLIPYPNVPNSPGVPLIPRLPGARAVGTTLLGAAEGFLWGLLQQETNWGIWDKKNNKYLGDPAIITGFLGSLLDSVGIGSTLSTNSVEFSKETKISDVPLELGSFASYNKVQVPATPVVTLCLTGTEENRKTFLSEIDNACMSVDLYDVYTPEKTYLDYSIERYRYERRAERGKTLMLVEISLKEIRQVTAKFKDSGDPKDAGAAAPVSGGKVPASAPPQSLMSKITGKVGSAVSSARQSVGL